MYDPDLSGVLNQQAGISALLGMNAGGQRLSGYEGASLPGSTTVAGDSATVPWSWDSPLLWGGLLVAGTVLGLLGASVDLRLGHRHASADVGDDR